MSCQQDEDDTLASHPSVQEPSPRENTDMDLIQPSAWRGQELKRSQEDHQAAKQMLVIADILAEA